MIEAILNSEIVAYLDIFVYCYRVGNAEQSVGMEGIRKHYRDLMKVTYNIGKKVENAGITNNVAINGKIQILMWSVFIYFSLAETYLTFKRNFVEFDKKVKIELPYIYEISMENRHLQDLRRSRYMLLLPMYFYIKLKYKI